MERTNESRISNSSQHLNHSSGMYVCKPPPPFRSFYQSFRPFSNRNPIFIKHVAFSNKTPQLIEREKPPPGFFSSTMSDFRPREYKKSPPPSSAPIAVIGSDTAGTPGVSTAVMIMLLPTDWFPLICKSFTTSVRFSQIKEKAASSQFNDSITLLLIGQGE